MKNKTLAIFGIVTYVLSVLSSATDLGGNSVMPMFLILISAIATLIYIIMVVIRLWKRLKYLSIIFILSSAASIVLGVIQIIVAPQYGNIIIILNNLARVIDFIVSVWVIVQLFKMSDEQTTNQKNTSLV